jgi:tetratricopeptide (TPR) repeat protein
MDMMMFLKYPHEKITNYLELVTKYIASNNAAFKWNYYIIGRAFEEVQDYETALSYFVKGMKQKNRDSMQSFINGMHCCQNNMEQLIEFCQIALECFPTRKYCILFALADRETNPKKMLKLSLESLFEYDQFIEKKVTDKWVLKASDTIKRYHILKKIAISYCEMKHYPESFQYWKQTIHEVELEPKTYYQSRRSDEGELKSELTMEMYNCYIDTMLLGLDYLVRTDEVQIYLCRLVKVYNLSQEEAKNLSIFQQRCMDKYLSKHEWSKIIQYSFTFLELCKHDELLTIHAHGYQCVAHYHNKNYVQCIEYGLRVCIQIVFYEQSDIWENVIWNAKILKRQWNILPCI